MKRTFLLWIALTAACGNPSNPTDAQSSDANDAQTTDTAILLDVVPADAAEAGTDARPDVRLDAAPDAPREAGVDAARDVAVDTGPADVGSPDVGADVGADVTPDVGSGGSDACVPRTTDDSAIGAMCDPSVVGDCPDGYTCQPFSGFVLTHSCQILCDSDCDCPSTAACTPASDKISMWNQCETP
jgi:hypothetical protein